MIVHGVSARCYAHSPTGALMAAVQIYSRLLLSMGSEWKTVMHQVASGPGKAELVAETEAEARTNPKALDAPPTPGSFPPIAGFQFVSYDGHTAVIDLVVSKSGAYAVAPLTVSWRNGDWELDIEPSGTLTGPAQNISSLVGYVAWSGT